MPDAPRPAGAAARLGLLGSLYFSQGLPFGFFTQALPVMLRQQGVSLAAIGATSLLAAPWALKFLWAPLVDRTGSRRFGRRRSWIVPLQLATALVLCAVGALADASATRVLLVTVFALNLCAATQDIATDALAVETLRDEERGWANGLQVAAYRVGMLVGGGALLVFHEALGWAGTFAVMAALILLASVPILVTREPPAAGPGGRAAAEAGAGAGVDGRPAAVETPADRATVAGSAAAVAPLVGRFLRRRGAHRALAIAFVFKFGESFASAMLRPFLSDRGLDLPAIGWLVGTVGFVSGLAGALLGGALVGRLGRRPALLAFGAAQACAVALYAALAASQPDTPLLALAIAAEYLTSGLATAALFTCMMDWSSRESAGTDYTVQASVVVCAQGGAAALSGVSAQHLGYLGHFALAATLCAVAVGVVAALFPRDGRVLSS